MTPIGCHLMMPGSTHITVIKLQMLGPKLRMRLRLNRVLASESAPPSSRRQGVRARERGSQLPNVKRSTSPLL